MKTNFVKTFEEMDSTYSTQANTPGIGDIEIPTDLPKDGVPVFPLSTSYITKKGRKKRKTKKKNRELGNKYQEK